jgi:hypothetical protein
LLVGSTSTNDIFSEKFDFKGEVRFTSLRSLLPEDSQLNIPQLFVSLDKHKVSRHLAALLFRNFFGFSRNVALTLSTCVWLRSFLFSSHLEPLEHQNRAFLDLN